MQARNLDPLYPTEIKVCISNAPIKVLPLSYTSLDPWGFKSVLLVIILKA